MRRLAGLGLSLLAISCVSARAFAEPPAPDAPPPPAAAPAPSLAPAPPQRKPWKEWLDREGPLLQESQETERIWYGWQTLLIDALALTAVAVTTSEGGEEGVWVGLGLLGLGSPVVHFAHRNVGEGLISLAIRLGSGAVVALGTVVAVDDSFVDGDGDEQTQGTVIIVVGLLGLASAVVIDAAHFGFEDRPVKARERAGITPWLDPERGRIGLGYTGTF